MANSTTRKWDVVFHDDFAAEYNELSVPVKIELAALALILSEKGPLLGRPNVDTLKGSRFANMKELRFDADGGVWRIAFAFDPERKAILLVAGNKSGIGQRNFYRALIQFADIRFTQHLAALQNKKG